MYAVLTFDEAQFPGLTNVRLWLANQTGEKAAALGDLCIKGKYAIAYGRKRRAHFVYKHADRLTGKVPALATCTAGTVLDQGVCAFESKTNA